MRMMKIGRLVLSVAILFCTLSKLFAQTQTWQAAPGYVANIQAQLNALSTQINSALLPPSATAGQFVIQNASATGYSAVTITGDLSCSVSTVGNCTVNSLSGNPITLKNLTGNSVGGPYGITNLNWNGVVDPRTYGVVYNNKQVSDMSCTGASSTCTSNSASFGTPDIGKDIVIVGPPLNWVASTPYVQNQLIQPAAQNSTNYIYRNVFPGTSGASTPVPPDWAASTYYIGNSYNCIKPSGNNAGAYVYCLTSTGGITGSAATPTFNQSVGGTTTDAGLTWTNEGTSTWPQLSGAQLCENATTGPCWVNTGSTSGNFTNTFTGCINAVNSATSITLGTLTAGSCGGAANYPVSGTTNNLYALYETDSTTNYQTAINSFLNGNNLNPGGSGRIVQSGWVAINQNLLFGNSTGPVTGSAIDLGCTGMRGNLNAGLSGTPPSNGSGFIWFGGNSPMLLDQTENVSVHGCGFAGNSNAANQPTTYFQLKQPGSTGVVSFNNFYNNYDTSQSFGFPDVGNVVLDDIDIFPSGVNGDRNFFWGNQFGYAQRAGFHGENTQSVGMYLNNNSFFSVPIGHYLINGGDFHMENEECNNSGTCFWVSKTTHLAIHNAAIQPGATGMFPYEFLYFQNSGNGSSDGQVEISDDALSVGVPINGQLAVNNMTVFGHTQHAASIIDTDGGLLTLIMNGQRFSPTSSGLIWTGGTPWLINLPTLGGGIVALNDVAGVTNSNLNVTSSGSGVLFHGSLSANNNEVMQTWENDLVNTDTGASSSRRDQSGANNFFGPVVAKQLISPSGGFSTSCTAGAANLFYKVTASNQPCNGHTIAANSEAVPAAEFTPSSCASPSPQTPVTLKWSLPANGGVPVSWGIYKGLVTNTETEYDCEDVGGADVNGFRSSNGNGQYNDYGGPTATATPTVPLGNTTGTIEAKGGIKNDCFANITANTWSAGVASTALPACFQSYTQIIPVIGAGSATAGLPTPGNFTVQCAQPAPNATSVTCNLSTATANATPALTIYGVK